MARRVPGGGGGEATIHYPFHPRSGLRVEIVRRHRFCGETMFVVRQPDGTLAQIPTWMFLPEAAGMGMTDRPRLALEGLRDLRLALDAILFSLSGMDGGGRDGARTGSATRGSSGADGAGDDVAADDAGDAGSVGGALLLEAMEAEIAASASDAAVEREAGDEQDRA